MKFKNTTFIIILVFIYSNAFAQITGSPYIFSNEEFTVASFYDVDEIGDQDYLFTLIPILEGDYYVEPVIWTSSDPALATINEFGICKIVNHMETSILFTATSVEDPTLVAKMSVNISEQAYFENLDSIEIVIPPSIEQRGKIPIAAFIQPERRRDLDAIFTVSDPSLAIIENDSITPLKDGEVTIYVESSESDTITSSRTIIIANVDDTKPPVLCIEYYDGQDTVYLQRSDTLTLPQALAKDEIDGELTVDITETGTSFNGNAFGTYPVTYYAIDNSSNEETVEVDFIVIDTLPPILIFDDANIEVGSTFEELQGSAFVLPTVTAMDENGDVLPVTIDDDGFDADIIGHYTILYTATDASGNTGETTIDVVVVMGFPPMIILSDGYVENDTIMMFQNDTLVLPSATATDALDNSVLVVLDTTGLDISTVGVYAIQYIAEDRFASKDTLDLFINVKDNTAPELAVPADTKFLSLFKIYVAEGTTDSLTTIEATDNVGVTHYTITEVDEGVALYDAPPTHDLMYEFLTMNGGAMTINSTGKIEVTQPSFGAQFFFKVKAFDALGNVDSTYFSLLLAPLQSPDIKVKISEIDEWKQIGFNDILAYTKEVQENTPVDSTVLYMDALGRGFAMLDSFSISGTGSEDFYLETIPNTNTAILKIKNALDQDLISTYYINVDVYGHYNVGATAEVVASFTVTLDVKLVEELAPDVVPIQALLGSGIAFTLRNLFALYDDKGLPTPSPALLGNELDDIFDTDLLVLPLIKSGIDIIGAKKLISLLPYALWITQDTDSGGNVIYRIFIKFKKGPASYQMEFVLDDAVTKAYYNLNVGSSTTGAGLQASMIHSSLAFLDHATGNLVLTSTTVNKSDFKCVKLASELNLIAGVHLVARGNVLPSAPSALFNPVASFRIGLTEAGWSVPGIVLNLDLDAQFLAAFDDEIVDFLFSASNVAKIAIEQAIAGVNIAKDNVHHAEYIFNQANTGLTYVRRTIERPQSIVNHFNNSLNTLNGRISDAQTEINDLLDDEICTPGCWIPIYVPAWCSKWWGGYPCLRHVGCVGYAICVPDPVSLAQVPAWYIYIGGLYTAQTSLIANRAIYIRALDIAKLPLIPAEIAVDQARISVDALRLILIGLEQGLLVTIDGFGAVGQVAKFVIDKGGNLVETSTASLETTLSAANNGTFAGSLGFALKFKGAPATNFNIAFSLSDPVAAATSTAQSLID